MSTQLMEQSEHKLLCEFNPPTADKFGLMAYVALRAP